MSAGEPELEPRSREVSGLVLMVVSAAAFALMAAVVKKLLPTAPTQAVIFSRGVAVCAVFMVMARLRGVPIVGKRPGMLLLRGLLGYGALSCYFYAVQHLPLGDAVLLQYSHPVFIAALAPIVLGETTRRGDWPLIVAALVGVALIVRPAGAVRIEALIGVVGSLLSGLAYMTIRRLAQTDNPLTILIWFPLATIPFSGIATIATGRSALPRDASEVAGHILVTLTALIGQFALTHGLTRAGAARATAVTLTGPVFGLAFGYLLFATVPSLASVIGTAIVLTAIGFLSWRSAQPED